VRYVSTRGEAPPLDFVGVTLAGLARDGGLYVPESWPRLEARDIQTFAGRPYAEVAVEVIRPFVGDAIAEHDLARMAREAYGSFRHPAVAPLTQYGVNDFMLELFHGPTLAFKDLAMQLLGRLMDHVLAARGERTTVVVATSGDTGGAAIEAFRGRNRTDVFVLFPHGRVSDVQRRMMTTAQDDNVHALAIEGTFDDCQAIVKGMFNHHAFRDRVSLSGVNSINWARIVAQAVYYFVAAVALGAPHRKLAFTVPTGNFGDVYAGYVALRMGLPIDRLVIATNVNDILVRTLATGSYETRDVVATTAPSMDIQVASNFERILFEVGGRDDKSIRAMMGSLAQSRRFTLPGPSLSALRAQFAANRADEQETSAAIRTQLRETGRFIDPHTAVGVAVAEKEPRDPAMPMVVLSTAHAAKFPEAVEAACGQRPALPDWLGDLYSRAEHFTTLPVDQAAIERHILSSSRAAREGAAA
jgi:threonine synthase